MGRGLRTMRRMRRRRVRRMVRRRVIVAGMVVAATKNDEVTKLSEADAKKVEEAAGKPIEEMTSEELGAAIEKTGVTEQEVTDEDVKALL